MRRASFGASSGGDDGSDSDDPFDEHAPVEIAPKEFDFARSGGIDDKLPNTLVVTVIQARALQPAPLRSTLRCYVKIASLGREYKTRVIAKSDSEPCWNESFRFRAPDWASSVTLSVRDRSNVKVRVLGHVTLATVDIANQPGMACQRWFQLRDASGRGAAVGDAELELRVALVYTARNDPSVAVDAIEDQDMIGGTDGMVITADQDDETEAEARARRHALERRDLERVSMQYANVAQGDYQIQVHVIEARDLKGENLSGTSDPYCQVEVLGQKKRTSTKYDTLGCVFDEILFFHFANIGRHELKRATIKIGVWDHEKVLRDNFIGAYQLDCLAVYCRPQHELYRQWIAVHDHLNTKDRGVQGFVLVSITVVGPGDAFVVHDREAELAKELAVTPSTGPNSSMTMASATNDASHAIVLLPPTIDLTLHFLLVKVVRCEDLPVMDAGGLVQASGIDAYVQIAFGATSAACCSSVVTVKGSRLLAPEFLEELWIPVFAPTLSRYISIGVWDRDIGRTDELVGLASYDYQHVRSAASPGGILALSSDTARRLQPSSSVAPSATRDSAGRDAGDVADDDVERTSVTDTVSSSNERVDLQWFNLYGPPLQRVNKKRAALALQHPELGSTYRGRVLLSMERVETPMPMERDTFHTKRMRESASTLASREPATVKYALRCALFCGTDIPQFHSALRPTKSTTKMRMTLGIGAYAVHFDAQRVERDGSVRWEQYRECWPIVLPADVTQLPDVVVTLSRQVGKDDFVGVAFARLTAADLFTHGFHGPTAWLHLREDVARRQTQFALDKLQSPGAVLVRLGFGREEAAARALWGDDYTLFTPFRTARVRREVRVHVFQLRRLVALADRVRLPNPFVSVTVCGQCKKVAPPQYKTLDPLFYASAVFTVDVPIDAALTPDILVQVHDANASTSAAVPTAVLAELLVPMAKGVKTTASASAPRPEWYALQLRGTRAGTASLSGNTHGDESRGEALLSIQYIDHGPAGGSIPPVQPLASLMPAYKDATLEIAALGVRRLKARSVVTGVHQPFVEFALLGGVFADGTTVRRTRASVAGASAKDATFLDRFVCPVQLPVDPLFTPQLSIRVCVHTLGGLRTHTLARCVVDLAPKLPWNSSAFVEPLTQRGAFANPLPARAVPTTAAAATSKATTRRRVRFSIPQTLTKKRSTVARQQQQHRATGIQDDTRGLQADDDRHDDGKDDNDVLSSGEDDSDPDDTQRRPRQQRRVTASKHRDRARNNGDDDVVPADDDVVPADDDDGIGIGDLVLPHASLQPTTSSSSSTDDPALRQQLHRSTQRRYLAAQNGMLLRGGSIDRSRSRVDTHTARLDSIDTVNTDADDVDAAALAPAPYMAGRDWWITDHGGEELEHFFTTPALETYALYRSVLTRPSLFERKRVRSELRAGVFKGRIAVRDRTQQQHSRALSTTNHVLDIERLGEPQALVVRVYVLRGRNLQAKDANGYSDPYVRLKLGSHIVSDRAHHATKTLNPEFGRLLELTATLPGPSQLEISVWDHDVVSADDLIGTTTIDLEDRWFHREWHAIGQDAPTHLLDAAGGCLKPIEYRHLYTPKRTTSQGVLQLWVDILTAQQAAVVPRVDIAPPAPQQFEVRVVLWRGVDITDKSGSDVNDYFVKVWLEGGAAQVSDVHWRCANSKPCWNWRFTLPVAYPVRTPEFARLHIQLWDKDVLKWNDVVGEAQLDLYPWLRRAFARNRTVAPFQELKALAKVKVSGDSSRNDGVSGSSDLRPMDSARRIVHTSNDTPSADDDASDDDGENESDDAYSSDTGRDRNVSVSCSNSARESHSLLRNEPKHATSTTAKALAKAKANASVKKPAFLTKASAADVKKTRDAKAQAEAKTALNGILDFLGLGELPDDAEWIPIHYTDREAGVSMSMGRLGISVQIVPEREAKANPVGKGQDAPNMNPYLPPPVGRMRLSANPFLMLKELVGPKLCLRLTLLCCCGACVFFIAVFGATTMSTLTYFQNRSIAARDSDDNDSRQLPAGLQFPMPRSFQDPRSSGSTDALRSSGDRQL